jgi:hypothetical protein
MLNRSEDTVISVGLDCPAHGYENLHKERPLDVISESFNCCQEIILNEVSKTQNIPTGQCKGALKEKVQK